MKTTFFITIIALVVFLSGCNNNVSEPLKNNQDNKTDQQLSEENIEHDNDQINPSKENTDYKKNDSTSESETGSLTKTPVINESETDNTLENYTNNKISISLNYPKNYTLDEPTPNADVVIIKQNNKKEYLQIQLIETTPPSLEKYRPNGANYIQDVSINSKNAHKYFTDSPIGQGVLEGYSFTNYIILISDKKWIQIQYYGDDKVFKDIIDSIKFNG